MPKRTSPPDDADIAALRAQIDELAAQLSEAQGLIVELLADREVERRHSPRHLVGGALRDVALRAAPPGTARRRALRRALVATRLRDGAVPASGFDRDYPRWLEQHTPTAGELGAMRDEAATWAQRPLVSVVVPVYNTRPQWLQRLYECVAAQTYDNWELCLADDASPDPHVWPALQRLAAADTRVRVTRRRDNGRISAATNSALELATGEFVAFVDHDDVITPHALHRVVERLQTVPDADILYTDFDLCDETGRRHDPHFTPRFSPHLLLGWNYITHLVVARRSLVLDVGGLRSEYDGAQDHDLLLRLSERARHIEKIDDQLYSWCAVEGSVAGVSDAKPYAYEAGVRAVADALHRRGTPGRVTRSVRPGEYTVRYQIAGNPRVAIVIPTRDRLDLLRRCVASIERRSTWTNHSITIVDNDSRDPATLEYLRTCGHQVVAAPGPFNYSRIINIGVRATDAEYVVTLNNDIEVRTPDWIEALLEMAQLDDVGVSGGQLRFPHGGVQHGGIALGMDDGVGYVPAGNYDIQPPAVRDVAAVTGACMMFPRQIFDAAGGFDETLGVAYNDVDFCLRVRAAGHGVVFTPHAVLVHRESASRGKLHPAADTARFLERWGDGSTVRDPLVSPHIRSVILHRLRV